MWIEIAALVLLLGLPLGAVAWVARIWRAEHSPDRLPILCYHRLTCAADLASGAIVDDEPVWTVLDTVFAAQMAWLAQDGWETLDLDDLLAIRAGERPAPARPIVITFDDGYESVPRLALPALLQHGHKAVVYAVLEPDQHTVELVAGLDRIMTADELAGVSAQGMAVESHTVTHAMLTELDDAGVRRELAESKRRIGEVTGKPVRHFCVPRAGHDARIVRLVAEAGYESCTGLGKGTARLSSDPMRLTRVAVERHHDVPAFARLLTPRHAAIHRILGDIRLLPTRLLGARTGYALRQVLYGPALRPIFGPKRLPALVAAGGVLWAVSVLFLLWRLWAR